MPASQLRLSTIPSTGNRSYRLVKCQPNHTRSSRDQQQHGGLKVGDGHQQEGSLAELGDEVHGDGRAHVQQDQSEQDGVFVYFLLPGRRDVEEQRVEGEGRQDEQEHDGGALVLGVPLVDGHGVGVGPVGAEIIEVEVASQNAACSYNSAAPEPNMVANAEYICIGHCRCRSSRRLAYDLD